MWSVTDKGRAALDAFPDPEVFFKESRRLYTAWKASQSTTSRSSRARSSSSAANTRGDHAGGGWRKLPAGTSEPHGLDRPVRLQDRGGLLL